MSREERSVSVSHGPLPERAPRAAIDDGLVDRRARRSLMQTGREVLRHPTRAVPVLSARWRLRGAARLPWSTRLWGRARLGGAGIVAIGDRVRIFGTIVPTEIVASKGARIEIGAGTFINYGVSIAALNSVKLGRQCQIGQYTIINDNDYHDIEEKRKQPPSQPVVLGDRVWLGARVIVTKGVTIGDDAVIGAGSVVTHDIPPRSVAVGAPARVIRRF